MKTDVLRHGRYRVERPLGSGAMGTVVLARDTVLGRLVAVKLLAGHLAADDAFRQRFLREARLAARLCHPNIVQVFDAGDDEDGVPFLVMEYVEGETVADRIAGGRRFATEEIVALAIGLSAGLAQAHTLGVVHRDVKPHNVILSRDGHPKLTDFGIARAREDSGLTEIGTVLGTAPFMAPEQAAGRTAGPAADVFALGALLRSAAGSQSSLPPPLDELVAAASAQDPDARPTAAEIHHRLTAENEDALGDAPTQVTHLQPTVIAPAPPLATLADAEPGRRPVPTRAVLIALAAVTALVLLLALVPRGDGDSTSVAPVPVASDAAQSARNLADWLRQQAD